jgi:prepilin-type processing-associated H-X9-DG protein
MGPTGPAQGGYPEQTPYQIVTGERQKWGASTYGLHGRRFNYLFHDGHVAIHRITDTGRHRDDERPARDVDAEAGGLSCPSALPHGK